MALDSDDDNTIGSISIDSNDGSDAQGGGDADRDMTEDEVALMVKNALRKARRAMHNSSPFSAEDKSLTSNNSLSIQPSESKSTVDDTAAFTADSSTEGGNDDERLGASASNDSESEVTRDKSREDDDDDDLARRIEEEIHSARAFAEKVYYGADSGKGPAAKNMNHSGDSKDDTEHSPSASHESHGDPIERRNSFSSGKVSVNSGRASVSSGKVSLSSGKGSVHSAETEFISNRTRKKATSKKKGSVTRDQSKAASPGKGVGSPGEKSHTRPPLPRLASPIEEEEEAAAGDLIEEAGEPVPDSLVLSRSEEDESSDDDSKFVEEIHALNSNDEEWASANEEAPAETLSSPNSSNFSSSSPKDKTTSHRAKPLTHHKDLQVNTAEHDGDDVIGEVKSPVRSIKFRKNSLSGTTTSPISTPFLSETPITPRSPIYADKYESSTNFSPSKVAAQTREIASRASHDRKSDLSPSSARSNTPSKQKNAREHRQVEFRHPYPLPPPPTLPRPDEVIIAENGVKETNIKVKWSEPKHDLLQLIEAAKDDSLVRRSNACGALKVLASKDTNQARLCRTVGLLDAFVIASLDDAVDSDALDARTRAVTSILYLSELKDNRLVVCKHPNLLHVLVKVIEEDTGEARLRACNALATLAKTAQNRSTIANTERLALVLSTLMVVNALPEKKEATKIGKAKKGNTTTTDNAETNTLEESRDESTDRDDVTDEDDDASDHSSVTEDDRLLANTFTGTFSGGTGTYTEDDTTHYTHEHSESGTEAGSYDEGEESSAGYSIEDEASIHEEGVEMQISSLKKQNIENHSDFLAKSQLSACATLTHLTKHCANSPMLCQNDELLDNVLNLARVYESPLHTRCIEMLCNFTRFPGNNGRLAATAKVIDTLLVCGKSKIAEDRMWAIRSIQNLCSDASSKVGLATGLLLTLLSTSAMRKDYDEQFAAVGALMNLSTEPGSIVPLTNTKTVVATLVHLAHSPNTPMPVRKIACDSLATIGLWLQTLASAGAVPEEIPFCPLPTHVATGWLRWDT